MLHDTTQRVHFTVDIKWTTGVVHMLHASASPQNALASLAKDWKVFLARFSQS